jgi:hypothetical protein
MRSVLGVCDHENHDPNQKREPVNPAHSSQQVMFIIMDVSIPFLCTTLPLSAYSELICCCCCVHFDTKCVWESQGAAPRYTVSPFSSLFGLLEFEPFHSSLIIEHVVLAFVLLALNTDSHNKRVGRRIFVPRRKLFLVSGFVAVHIGTLSVRKWNKKGREFAPFRRVDWAIAIDSVTWQWLKWTLFSSGSIPSLQRDKSAFLTW